MAGSRTYLSGFKGELNGGSHRETRQHSGNEQGAQRLPEHSNSWGPLSTPGLKGQRRETVFAARWELGPGGRAAPERGVQAWREQARLHGCSLCLLSACWASVRGPKSLAPGSPEDAVCKGQPPGAGAGQRRAAMGPRSWGEQSEESASPSYPTYTLLSKHQL